MTPINNNQVSEHELIEKVELLLVFYDVGTESYNPKNRIHLINELVALISHERAEAKAEARMELEVEVGLQKFGQLMKEKEKIQAEVVEKVITWVKTNQKGQFEDEVGNICWYLDDLVTSLEKYSKQFLSEENPSA